MHRLSASQMSDRYRKKSIASANEELCMNSSGADAEVRDQNVDVTPPQSNQQSHHFKNKKYKPKKFTN